MDKSCEVYPNMRRSDYCRYAAHPLGVRLMVSGESADHAMKYFHDTHVPDTGRLPTYSEWRRVERLNDYILAEDHKKGLSLRDRAKPEPEEDEVYPQVGSCARQFMEYHYYLQCVGRELSEIERRRVKVCAVCGCEFMDRSRRNNALVCRYPCLKTYGNIKKRRQRNDGDPRLMRYRERQDLEYPFYSPAELFEISQRGETVSEDIGDTITIAKLRQELGRRVPTEITMDDEYGYFPNSHKRWRSEEEAKNLAGPVVIYNLHQEQEEKTEFYLGHVS